MINWEKKNNHIVRFGVRERAAARMKFKVSINTNAYVYNNNVCVTTYLHLICNNMYYCALCAFENEFVIRYVCTDDCAGVNNMSTV